MLNTIKNTRFIFALMGLLIQLPCYGHNDSIINNDYVNIATLKVDYETYEFEGGDISYYSCPNCPDDSIPFTIEYDEPGDFGGITFTLSSLQDTIFDASIIWMGTGQIYYPTYFSTATPFSYTDTTINKPNDVRYITHSGYETTDTVFIEKADSAWNSIDSLEITKLFYENDFKTAIYKYPPTLGIFDPSVAKWIIFLYHKGHPGTSIDQEGLNPGEGVNIHPNPATTHINLESKTDGIVSVYSMQGKKMLSSHHHANSKQTINISLLSKGLYVIKFKSNDGKVTVEKLVVW